MEKYLVIGLGSMGKRRVRCLLALGKKKEQIIGLDLREDRRKEASELYGISTFDNSDSIDYTEIVAAIVSLPPDNHFVGAKIAIDHNLPVFIEASVVLDDVEEIIKYNNGRVFIAPSYTMCFNPPLKVISEIVKSKKYGKVTNFTYHSGQYLPDWHPWESVNDYYVGQRKTGGAREIVPFELTWITELLGFPKEIKGVFRKTMDIGCDIEDTYTCTMIFDDCVGCMTVDVVARYAIRSLYLNMEKGQIQWSWDEDQVKLYDAINQNWIYIKQPELAHHQNYNANINEKMYIEEIATYLDGIKDHSKYYNTIEKDRDVLRLLKGIEDSDGGYERGVI